MPEPGIDVVVPAYQAERWLGAAIESILAQRDAPLREILVVDNGSSDGTAAVAARYPAPVRCLATGRTNSADARNTGLAASRAEFLAFLDADDLMPPDSLASRWRALVAGSARDAVVAGLVLPFRDGQALPADCQDPALRPWTQRGLLGGTMMLPRAVFDRIGHFDRSLYGADMPDWLVRFNDSGLPVVHIDQVVLLRRLHGASMTQASFGGVTADYLKILRRHLRRREGQG
jgi:glycosyltransferase involved in cell wall biosynthesis